LFYIVTADIERRKPDKIIEDILAYHGRFKFTQFGFEANQFQVLMLQNLEKRGQEKGTPIPTVPLKNTGPKTNRIQSFQPCTKSGMLQFFHGHRQLRRSRTLHGSEQHPFCQ
jgi:hypothetical protein